MSALKIMEKSIKELNLIEYMKAKYKDRQKELEKKLEDAGELGTLLIGSRLNEIKLSLDRLDHKNIN